jgi:ribosomal protein S18 acetylase RimI-like enzyme
MTTTIARATGAQAGAVIGAIRAGFPPGVQGLSIYGCPGAARFVADEIRLGPALSERAYSVALADGAVAGAIELRRLPRALFLNYISVLPEFHGRGLATSLLREATREARAPQHGEMQLDVFADNDVARVWYERLGFQAVGTTDWWVVEGAPPGRPQGVYVHGFAQAEASHAAFGFSQLAVETGTGRHAVGRLGADWFRLTRPDAVGDAALGGTLAELDPARRILALIPAGTLPSPVAPRAKLVRRSLRMHADIEALTAALDSRATVSAGEGAR